MNFSPRNAVVWFELNTPDLDKAADFYQRVLQAPVRREEMMGSDMAVFSHEEGLGAGGSMTQPQEPAPQPIIVHLEAPAPITDALERVSDAGGQVISDPFDLPNGGKFAYCKDPHGTQFGVYTAS